MSSDSSQKWLERNRPPRVQISYDVETGGALQKKELPLVVGVLSDLSGMTAADGSEKRLIEIDRDNFNTVLEKIGPTIDVAGLGLRGEGLPAMSGTLTFKTIDDFTPDEIVKKVSGLSELYETRKQLRDLMAKLDGNAALESQLTRIFFDQGTQVPADQRNKLLDALLGNSDSKTDTKPEVKPEVTPAPPVTGSGDDDKPATT